MWHKVAPALAEHYTVVAPDMRGYGDSDKSPAPDNHEVYCKRTTANDLVELMTELGHESWHVVGHDRGARVAHRMILDHPQRVTSFTSPDVVASQADSTDAHHRPARRAFPGAPGPTGTRCREQLFGG